MHTIFNNPRYFPLRFIDPKYVTNLRNKKGVCVGFACNSVLLLAMESSFANKFLGEVSTLLLLCAK